MRERAGHEVGNPTLVSRADPATPLETELALVVTLALTAGAVVSFAFQEPAAPLDARVTGGFLWLFLGLFLLRVAGQVLVARRAPAWLPPMAQWHQVPYGVLLPAQLVLLVLMGWIAVDLSRGDGFFARPRPGIGQALVWLSYGYAAVMAVRYGIRMRRQPDQRWAGGAIPIVFHFVLAAFAFTLGSYHASY